MNAICICFHTGLGDQLMLNGMIRHFAEKRDVYLFVQRSHKKTVEFMYRDIAHRVGFIFLDTTDPKEISLKITTLPRDCEVVGLGSFDPKQTIPWSTYEYVTSWAYGAYFQAKVNPVYMYTKFKVIRARSNELEPPTDDYIFVHDKDYNINITTDHAIYRPPSDDSNIFEHMTILENAKEIHCINSVYAWLVTLMGVGHVSTNTFHMGVAYPEHDHMVETVFMDNLWTFRHATSPPRDST